MLPANAFAGIAVDENGNAYVTGPTTSPDFPTTPGAFQRALAGPIDTFVTKLNHRGSALLYSTYFGGSSFEVLKPPLYDIWGGSKRLVAL